MMKEARIIGKLLPTHPDIFPILVDIREKFDIPDISPEGDVITEIFLADEQIDWDVKSPSCESLSIGAQF
jgi:hypothetical protein